MSGRRNDFNLRTDDERYVSKVQSAVLSLDKIKEYGNQQAQRWNRQKQKIAAQVAKTRDECRRNIRFIQANPRAKFTLSFFCALLIGMYLYDVYVPGRELTSFINHWIFPFFAVCVILLIALGILYLAEELYDDIVETSHLKEKDPRLVWKSWTWSSYKTACIAKVVYLLIMIAASLYATAHIYLASQVGFGSGSDEAYGVTDGEISDEYSQYFMGTEQSVLSEKFGILMPIVFGFISVLGHGFIMLSGKRVFTALGYLWFMYRYKRLTIRLNTLQRQRDASLTAIGKAFSSYSRQVKVIESLDGAFIDDPSPFSGLAEEAHRAYLNGAWEDDPDILGEFLNGGQESKYEGAIPPPEEPPVDIEAAFEDNDDSSEEQPSLWESLFGSNHKSAKLNSEDL